MYGLGRNYEVIAKNCHCSQCGCDANGLNEKVYNLLPPEIQAHMPFKIYNQTRVDKRLVSALCNEVSNGMSFRGFRKKLIEVR